MEAAAQPPPPPPSAPAPRGIDVGRVVRESFSIYAENAAPLLITAFIVVLIAGLIQGLLSDGGIILQLIGTVVSLVATAIYTGFVVKLVADVRDGSRDFSVGDLISSASPYIVPLIVNGVLRGIAIAIGLILFIIPGLFLMTIWAVTSPAIVVEGEDGIGAFGRSSELTSGQRMNVFLTILVVFLITFVVSFIVLAIGASIGTGALIALSILVATITQPVAALVASVLFFDLGGGVSSAGGQQVAEY
ncbi:MAG: hypothetical protein R2700_13190 [Solirubrobacterales bacterium]